MIDTRFISEERGTVQVMGRPRGIPERLGLAAVITALAMAPQGRPAGAAEPAGPPRYPYNITCTTGMVTDIVREIAADKAQVVGLIGEGVDPHLYQATRNDIAKLMSSDIVFYNGLMLEGKMSDALIRVGRSKPVYAVTELIDAGSLLEPKEFAGHYDPHVWMDVSLWRSCTEMAARTLAEFDPANADYYRANFERYAAQLDALHTYAREKLGTIPAARRVLVTAHDAFNYMARAYAMEVRGIQGISTESEAGIADINAIVELLVDRGIRAVFVETSVSEKNVRALIEGARAKGHEVVIGGLLFSDAMGKPGTYEGTYIGMIDHNVTIITRALGGTADPGGMKGGLAGSERR